MNGTDDNSLMNGVISSGEIMLQPSATVSSMNETQNHGLTTIENDTRRPNEVHTSILKKGLLSNFYWRSDMVQTILLVDLKTRLVYLCVQKIPPGLA